MKIGVRQRKETGIVVMQMNETYQAFCSVKVKYLPKNSPFTHDGFTESSKIFISALHRNAVLRNTVT